MSRSYQRHKIAWGRATEGGANRCKTSYSDDVVNKNRKKYGKILIRKRHWRSELQTKEDYIKWVKDCYNTSVHPELYAQFGVVRENKVVKQLMAFLNGREATDELIEEFAINLWKKDRSK